MFSWQGFIRSALDGLIMELSNGLLILPKQEELAAQVKFLGCF